jgi:hypothetical protein
MLIISQRLPEQWFVDLAGRRAGQLAKDHALGDLVFG